MVLHHVEEIFTTGIKFEVFPVARHLRIEQPPRAPLPALRQTHCAVTRVREVISPALVAGLVAEIGKNTLARQEHLRLELAVEQRPHVLEFIGQAQIEAAQNSVTEFCLQYSGQRIVTEVLKDHYPTE